MTSSEKTTGSSQEQKSASLMKLGTSLNPAISSMAEAAGAVSTCGKYRKISKVNTEWLLILTSDRLRPDKRKRGTRYDMKNDNINYGGKQRKMRYYFLAWFLKKTFVQFESPFIRFGKLVFD